MSEYQCRTTFFHGCLYGLLLCVLPNLVYGESNSSSSVDAITTGGSRAITTGGSRAITTGGSRAITTGGSRAITTGGSRAITTGGSRAITTGGSRAITTGGSRLLVYGRVDAVGSDFISVLGQTVFGSIGGLSIGGLSVGAPVAVYGSIDMDSGGIVGASIVDAGQAGFAADSPSFLTGIVDAVDYSNGSMIVSGQMVDYNGYLSTGMAPSVGDQVEVTGRHYGSLGMLVADPQMSLQRR